MPAISRALIRTSAAYLAAAALLGVLLAAPSVLPFRPPAGLEPARLHLLVVGWITQLVFGVALWMFPRRRERVRVPSGAVAWTAYGALNVGLLLRLVGEPWVAADPGSGAARGLMALSAVGQWGAVLYFAARLWSRTGSRS